MTRELNFRTRWQKGFSEQIVGYGWGTDWVSEEKTQGRWALALLVLIMFPAALVGSATLIRLYNESGRQLPLEWTRDYREVVESCGAGGAQPGTLVACENGDVILVGTDSSFEYFWLMRVCSDGSVAWVNTDSPPSASVWFSDIVRLSSNRYLVIGQRDANSNGSRTWLLCIDGLGRELWNQSYDDFGYISRSSFGVACSDGGAAILSSTPSGMGESICALRIDSDGALLWNMTYPEVWSDMQVDGAASASDGSILVVGSAQVASSSYHTVRCLEPTGSLRWSQNYSDSVSDSFSSVASGSSGNYVLIGPSRALCLDNQGRERWSLNIPLGAPYRDRAVVACGATYFLLCTFIAHRGVVAWGGLCGISVSASGTIVWSWFLEGLWSLSPPSRVTASDDGNLYILPHWIDKCLLLRLPNPPLFTSSAALLAESSYTLVIVSVMTATILLSRYRRPNAPRRQARTKSDLRVLLKANLALQAILLLSWTVLILFFGPVHSYYEPHPMRENVASALLFWLLSPVGATGGILGVVAFTGLQLGLYPLDRQFSQKRRRSRWTAPTILTCACVALVVFLGVFAAVWVTFYLMMLPFVNGVVLAGFLPKYLLSRRWSE